MELNKALENITYLDIVNGLSNKPGDMKKIEELKHFYRKAQTELKFSKSVITAAIIFALRLKKSVIPSASYLEKTLIDNFKYCKTSEDAAVVLRERIQFEIDAKEQAEKTKKQYQGKVKKVIQQIS